MAHVLFVCRTSKDAKRKGLPMFAFAKSHTNCSRKPNFKSRGQLTFEKLQPRELMASDVFASLQPSIDISAEEQLMVELINRARANPAAEAARFGIDLNAGISQDNLVLPTAKQPLAPVAVLQTAASRHSTDMLMRDYFAHDAKVPAPNGRTPTDRGHAAGYRTGVGENLALWPLAVDGQEANVLGSHQLLFNSPGHRSNILAEYYNDIGVGIELGEYTGDLYQGKSRSTMMTTEKFGLGDESRKAITGVIFADTSEDNDFYNLGEGVMGVKITAIKSTGEQYSTTSGTSGGYSLQVPKGSYQVYAFDGRMLGLVEVNTANIKLDLMTDRPNMPNPSDTNKDGMISPLDALLVINHLNRDPSEIRLAIFPDHLDVNRDGAIKAIDALIVINELNRADRTDQILSEAEAEAEFEAGMESQVESGTPAHWDWSDPSMSYGPTWDVMADQVWFHAGFTTEKRLRML